MSVRYFRKDFVLGRRVVKQNTLSFSVDGMWSPWGEYDTCSKTCGGGSQTRRRTCDNPKPANGGKNCAGDSEETQSCNTQGCPGKSRKWFDFFYLNTKYISYTLLEHLTHTCYNLDMHVGYFTLHGAVMV